MHNIVYLYQDHYPWDVRAEKIVTSLANQGNRVTLLSRNRTGAPRSEFVHPRVEVRRLPSTWLAATRDLVNFPAFFSPVWIYSILRCVQTTSASVIVVRDLPMAPAAYMVARLTSTPVMMDMAENYPAMLADTHEFDAVSWPSRLIRNPTAWRMIEQWLLPRLDVVLAVSEVSAERVSSVRGSSSGVHVVGNTPRLDSETLMASSELADAMANDHNLKLLYVGGLERMRGIDIVISAMTRINQHVGPTTFYVAGGGPQLAALEAFAREQGVSDHVVFSGQIDHALVPQVIASADICLVPHYATEHTNTTIPNKIFDYMLQSKPVLCSDCTALVRIVTEHSCGMSYRDRDPEDLARVCSQLRHPELRAEMGRRGREAVLSHLNWSCDEQTLIDSVDEAVNRSRSA